MIFKKKELAEALQWQELQMTVGSWGDHFLALRDFRAADFDSAADDVSCFLAGVFLGAGRLDTRLVIFLAMGVLGFRAGAAFLTGVALAGGGIFLEAALLSEDEVFLAEAAGLFAGAGFLLVVLGFFLGGGWRFLGAGLFWLLRKMISFQLFQKTSYAHFVFAKI